jgi:ATP dependent DNA ligase C terminal region
MAAGRPSVALRVEARRGSCDWPQIRAEQPALVTQPQGFRPPISLCGERTPGSSPDTVLISAVRQHGFEGIVAKHVGSPYRSGERCGDWLKWRVVDKNSSLGATFLAMTTSIPSLSDTTTFATLSIAGRVRAGLTARSRHALLPHFEELRVPRCPFGNLPERTEGHWGEGLTAAKMDRCRWLDPFLVVRIEFLEWTPENRLRHPRFAGIRSDKDARDVMRDGTAQSRSTK